MTGRARYDVGLDKIMSTEEQAELEELKPTLKKTAEDTARHRPLPRTARDEDSRIMNALIDMRIFCRFSFVFGSRRKREDTESQCFNTLRHTDQASAVLDMTALKRICLCILWLSVFLVFSACYAAGWLSTLRFFAILGSILGLVPASLHFRTSQTQTPPCRLWRWCSVLVIVVFGSLSFLAWVPGMQWHSPLPFESRAWLRVVDTISCISISGVLAVCATVFRWCAWLMLSRTSVLLPETSESFVITYSSTFVNLATLCFHLHWAVETIFDHTPASLVVQLTLAGTFVLLWMLLCISIAHVLRASQKKLQKEADLVCGAPRAEALWAKRLLSVELAACLALAFSCTQFTWIPYELTWAFDRRVAEYYLSIPLVLGHRLDMLIKTVSVATLSGLLWTPNAPNVQKGVPQVQTMHIPVGADAKAWAAHVKVLANRGFTLHSLLVFWHLLGDVMPSFDPLRSTTNDVVRLAIIPLSRHEGWTQSI
eukprot:Skav220035  [mRNA]  locus=scaffold2981:201642:204712:+ [translate_table: standard]